MTPQERLNWLKTRLGTMGPVELVSRLSDSGRHIALRASLERVGRRAHRRSETSDRLLGAPELNGQLQSMPSEIQDRILENAVQWLNHRASFFALRDMPLGDSIDWHRDYSSNLVGPTKYSAFINHRDTRVAGNVKYIWELNRLQHLVLLALASSWTGNKAYTEEIERQMLSWQMQNRFMKGLNWKSPLEAGIRLISWAFISFLTAGLHRTGNIVHADLRETIYQHQYFIRKFYSKHSSANNHLIGEMAGLYVASIFWPWYRESAAWRSFARQKLIQESLRQVEADGVGKERATDYQLFILEFFLLAGALGHIIGDPFPPEYWERLQRMVIFLTVVSDRSGNVPMLGDGDSGQVVWLPESLQERGHGIRQIGNRHDGATPERNLRSLLLLWGQNAVETPLAPVPIPEQSLHAFPDGGYYVLAANRGSENEIVVVFDAGVLGLPPLYAHGHADALSFWLSYGGREFFIDPGTFCYYTEPAWRAYFRGTGAHNTVRMDGEDQSIAAGPFLWRHVANCRVERIEETAEFVEVTAVHDGYRRLQDPVLHRRRLRLFKEARNLLITDHLECCRPHTAEVFFHFSEKCQVRQMGPRSFEASTFDKRLAIQIDSSLKPILYRASEHPISGWVSPGFDVKKPSFTLVARGSVVGTTQFLSRISGM